MPRECSFVQQPEEKGRNKCDLAGPKKECRVPSCNYFKAQRRGGHSGRVYRRKACIPSFVRFIVCCIAPEWKVWLPSLLALQTTVCANENLQTPPLPNGPESAMSPHLETLFMTPFRNIFISMFPVRCTDKRRSSDKKRTPQPRPGQTCDRDPVQLSAVVLAIHGGISDKLRNLTKAFC
jgi:hypothetical protein